MNNGKIMVHLVSVLLSASIEESLLPISSSRLPPCKESVLALDSNNSDCEASSSNAHWTQ